MCNRYIGLTDSLTDLSKFKATSRSGGNLKFCILKGLGVEPTGKIENPKICDSCVLGVSQAYSQLV